MGYTDGDTLFCPESCKLLKLQHYIHSPLEKSFIAIPPTEFKGSKSFAADYYYFIWIEKMYYKLFNKYK